MQPNFWWVGIFQIASPSCCIKSETQLSFLLRGIHDALEVPLKVSFVLAEEAVGVNLVTRLD